MKFVDVKEVFAEIPDEITLAISISGCPIRCKGCHSGYLWEDVGEELTEEVLVGLVREHLGVSCVCLMGGDQAPEEVNRLLGRVKETCRVRTAWYSGRPTLDERVEPRNLDYVKLGPWVAERGPLSSRNTNQRLYRLTHEGEESAFTDITSRFWDRL
ncbi:MAG: anaerobic ribonucleoside-triphosphate reductase activating protein [Bacteroidaceae bacterium]|nr:anaerobic ribonucleoside-triphosphate reductase activating protein [Bacteroidaceae bacterium]